VRTLCFWPVIAANHALMTEDPPHVGAETPNLATGPHSGEAAHTATCLLETFRGAARGASGAALRPVYSAVQAVQVIVATLHAVAQ